MRKGFVLFLAVALLGYLAAGPAWAEVARGKVSGIDLAANKIQVTTAEGESLSLTFEPDDFIVWQGDDEVEPMKITQDAEAEVGYYTDEAGAKIASWVDLTPAEAEAGEEEMAPEEGLVGEEMMEPGTMGKEHPGQEHPGEAMPGMAPKTQERSGKEHPGTTQ